MTNSVRLYLRKPWLETLYAFAFWAILGVAVGFYLGDRHANMIVDRRLSDVATYKAIKINGTDYDLKERP